MNKVDMDRQRSSKRSIMSDLKASKSVFGVLSEIENDTLKGERTIGLNASALGKISYDYDQAPSPRSVCERNKRQALAQLRSQSQPKTTTLDDQYYVSASGDIVKAKPPSMREVRRSSTGSSPAEQELQQQRQRLRRPTSARFGPSSIPPAPAQSPPSINAARRLGHLGHRTSRAQRHSLSSSETVASDGSALSSSLRFRSDASVNSSTSTSSAAAASTESEAVRRSSLGDNQGADTGSTFPRPLRRGRRPAAGAPTQPKRTTSIESLNSSSRKEYESPCVLRRSRRNLRSSSPSKRRTASVKRTPTAESGRRRSDTEPKVGRRSRSRSRSRARTRCAGRATSTERRSRRQTLDPEGRHASVPLKGESPNERSSRSKSPSKRRGDSASKRSNHSSTSMPSPSNSRNSADGEQHATSSSNTRGARRGRRKEIALRRSNSDHMPMSRPDPPNVDRPRRRRPKQTGKQNQGSQHDNSIKTKSQSSRALCAKIPQDGSKNKPRKLKRTQSLHNPFGKKDETSSNADNNANCDRAHSESMKWNEGWDFNNCSDTESLLSFSDVSFSAD